MNTELGNVKGWTPIVDNLSKNKDYGLVGSAVFGVVWRHCQMRNGVCSASQSRLAELLGITRMTVNKYIGKLVEDGYLVDLSPGLKNRPHVYQDTGLATIDNNKREYMSYKEYLQSDKWKEFSKIAKEKAHYKCGLCNASGNYSTLHTHHKSYDNLYYETLSDVIVLCDSCHRKFHDIKSD